jgi:DNA invertase Pin-like site-specific DNA recombinase
VSTEDQAKHGWSLDAQRHRIEGYCQAKEWELVEVYADEGVSAVKDRPAFKRMVEDVLADGVSHVVALKLDRLGRSARGLLELFERLEARGVGLVCIDDSIDTSTPSGKLLRTILAGVAEFERDVISERTKTGMAEARRRGARFGKVSTLDPAVVERIRTDRAAGLSLSAIARSLDAEGIPTGQGGRRWYASTVRAIALGPHPETAEG